MTYPSYYTPIQLVLSEFECGIQTDQSDSLESHDVG